MLRFKDDVKIAKLQPQTVLALVIADQIYSASGRPECWVTSLNDGEHSVGSKHYDGLAADLRTRDLEDYSRKVIYIKMVGRLRPLGFDVLDEGDHFHLEYDPKP